MYCLSGAGLADERGLKSFIEGLLTGRQKVVAYPASGLPAIVSQSGTRQTFVGGSLLMSCIVCLAGLIGQADTEEWDGKDGKVEEDAGLDDEMMEFLKEQQAEREAEEKAAAEEAEAEAGGDAEEDDSDL
jgi:hypothetical protein